jgi:hypothetical protein
LVKKYLKIAPKALAPKTHGNVATGWKKVLELISRILPEKGVRVLLGGTLGRGNAQGRRRIFHSAPSLCIAHDDGNSASFPLPTVDDIELSYDREHMQGH